ncbi:MAG: restriction endonuclease subunit S [Leptolyngbyaceae cyanobacterium bins.349]|nr:restriction endonuclease subunit S [Leptolyngbyaceae cyanobacterium bins.349]
MDQFPRYERYKDSGVEWLGEIPNHWRAKAIKYASSVNPSGDRAQKDEQVTFLPMEAVLVNGEYDMSKVDSRNAFPASLTEFKQGDVLLAKITPCFENGKGAFLEKLPTDKGIGSTEFHVFRVHKDQLEPRFLYYAIHNQAFRSYAEVFMEGTAGQKRITTPFISNTKIPVPSLEEQQRIVEFLDRTTTEIDRAISQKQRLIELLQEQKAILINQAVTKGLNPNVPMRDSGIEWIGEIPDHWSIIRNRYIFSEQNERSQDGSEIHLSMSQKLGLVPSDELTEKTLQSESYEGAKLCRKCDLVLNRLKAHLGVFSVSLYDGLVSPDYSVFRLMNPSMTPEYFESLFRTSLYIAEFNKRVKGIVVGFYRLYTDAFYDIPCICPSDSEQRDIKNYILKMHREFNFAENFINSEMNKLNELKQIVIADAVTGKIKV